MRDEYHISVDEKLTHDVIEQCNARDELLKSSEAEGRAMEHDTAMLQVINSIMTNLSISFEKAAELLELTPEDCSKYKHLIENN